MIRKLLRVAFSLFSLFATLYFVFFVPLGRYTLWEHIWRIARTPEARELGDAAGKTAVEATEQVKREASHLLREWRERTPPPDASTDPPQETTAR